MTDRTPNDDDPVYQVEDEDDLVARKKKKMIVESRSLVNDIQVETSFSTGNIRGNAHPGHIEAVRSFLRNIEPLLMNSKIQGSREAYNEAFLGKLVILPPVDPNTKSTPDHLEDRTPQWAQNRDKDLVLHRLSDSVEPRAFKVTGLKEIISSVGYSASWDVTIDKGESRGFSSGGLEKKTVTESKNWTRDILNNAVRTADQFLENANVGFTLAEDDPQDGFLDL
jgi:hypothetical protein